MSLKELRDHPDRYCAFHGCVILERLAELIKYPERLIPRRDTKISEIVEEEKMPDPAIWVVSSGVYKLFGYMSDTVSTEFMQALGFKKIRYKHEYFWKIEEIKKSFTHFCNTFICVYNKGKINNLVTHPLLKKIKCKKTGNMVDRKIDIRKDVYTIPPDRLPA
jgi:hypothetical protein